MLDRNDPKITGAPGRISCASAMPDSASAICCTSAAGIVTGDIAPIRMNGVSTHGWPAGGVLEQRLEHPVVPAQRRVAVDQRDRHRRLLDRLAAAEEDLAHRDGVAGVDAGDHVAHVDLVGQRLQRVGHVEVPRVERRVVGLADHAAGRVEHREGLGELGEPLEVVHRRVAAHVALAHERRPVDRAEGHRVAADVDVVLGVAGLDVELARRLGDLLEDELGVEEDRSAPRPSGRPRGTASSARSLSNSTPISVTSRRQPGVQLGHRVLGEDLVPRHLVAEHSDLLDDGHVAVSLLDRRSLGILASSCGSRFHMMKHSRNTRTR